MKPGYWLAAGFALSLLVVGAISSISLLTVRHADEAASRAILKIVTASYEGGATRSDVGAVRSDVSDLAIRIDDVRGKINAIAGHTASRRYSSLATIKALSGHPFILIVGDSIAEAAPLPDRICGLPVINAAIGGSRASDFIPIVEDIVASNPKIAVAVIAVGLNDSQIRLWAPHKAKMFAESYSHLVRMLPSETLILSTITPVDVEQETGRRFSLAGWAAVDAEIRAVAKKRNIPLIDNSTRLATTDGAHPTLAGYLPWVERTETAIKNKLGC